VSRPTLEDVYLSLTDGADGAGGGGAAAIVNAVILPLEFLSGIFIAFGDTTPSWILWVARVFPVRHFAVAMQAGFLGTPFSWTNVLVVVAWGVAGLLIAIRFFSWEPRLG